MAGFNKVILVGNLTRNPELRYTPSGTPVASFGLATSRRFKDREVFRAGVRAAEAGAASAWVAAKKPIDATRRAPDPVTNPMRSNFIGAELTT